MSDGGLGCQCLECDTCVARMLNNFEELYEDKEHYRIIAWTIVATTTDGKDHYIAEMPNWLAKEIDKFLFGKIEPILQKNGDVDMWDMEEEE